MGAGLIITILINFATLALSIASALFIAGLQLGKIKTDISNIKEDVAEIRAMFRLQPKRRNRKR